MESGRKKIISGLIWTYSERMLAQIISTIVTIILARLILPEEYGMIAIVAVIIAIVDTFAVNGLGNALIQKKDADELDFSSVFYFNIVFSIAIYIIVCFLALPIARFYSMPELTSIIRVMGLRIPIAAVNSVQQAYVSRKMQFKKFFFSTLGGTVISAILGITLAYCNFGVWALVAQYLSNICVDTIVLWFTVGWRPQKKYSHARLKTLFSFGWKVLATSLLITIYSNVQDLIIGKKFSSADLAFSNKGKQFPQLISTNINTSISKVLFPAISDVQDNISEVKAMSRRAVGIGTYLLSPVLIGLAAISDKFILLLLTDKWIACVPYLKIMCIIYLLQPIQTASIQAMKALGRSDIYLKLEIVKKIFGILVLLVTVLCFKSVLAIIVGSLVSECFSTIANIPANRKLFHYTIKEQLFDVLPTFTISLIMYIGVSFLRHLAFHYLIVMILQIIVGVGVYFALSYISRNKNFYYVLSLIKKIKIHGRKDNDSIS